MIDARFVPLELSAFPGGARKVRRPSTAFSSTYQRTLDRLENELQKLGAIDVTIQAGYRRDEIRNDGWPRSSARPSHPAVVVSFRVRRGNEEYSFPCDTFSSFEHNLHAIAYTLEALRDVARYGVTRGREQYKGFAQIEATKPMTLEESAAWIAPTAPHDLMLNDPEFYRRSYREAAKLHYPHDGQTAHWLKLQEAKELLDRHHGFAVEQVHR